MSVYGMHQQALLRADASCYRSGFLKEPAILCQLQRQSAQPFLRKLYSGYRINHGHSVPSGCPTYVYSFEDMKGWHRAPRRTRDAPQSVHRCRSSRSADTKRSCAELLSVFSPPRDRWSRSTCPMTVG